MKRYKCSQLPPSVEGHYVYLASDVEERIAKLEKALREIVRTAATIPGSVCGGDLHPVVAQYLVSARSVESARSLLGL